MNDFQNLATKLSFLLVEDKANSVFISKELSALGNLWASLIPRDLGLVARSSLPLGVVA